MNPKRSRFIDEYLIDLNASQAAIRAGYSKATAGQAGARLLKNVQIQEEIEQKRALLEQKTGITQQSVLKELAKIAFSDTRKLYDQDGALKAITELDDDTAASLSGVETDTVTKGEDEAAVRVVTRKVRRWDKVKALELIGKQLGMFVEQVEHSGNMTVVFDDPTQRPEQVNGYHRKPSIKHSAD